jgi:heptosyltransferase-2
MRIIINALSGIGDAVMFSPALEVLKNKLPDAKIDVLAMFQQVEQYYKANKHINKVHFIDFLNQSKIKSLFKVSRLRSNKYDASINVYPSNRREYNFINRLLGAKKRIAVKYSHYSFSNWDFLNTHLKPETKNRHNVLQNFDLIKFLVPDASESDLKGYDSNISIDDEVHATEYLIDNLLTDKFLVGFHAGSATFKRHINKRWDADKFAELANELHQRYAARILLLGTEKELNRTIYNKIQKYAYMPEFENIMHTIALMKKCMLIVANDASLMHLACAVHVPVVAIFAYTNYKELSPWKNRNIIVRKDLDCSPCFFNSPKPVRCIYSEEDEFKCIKTIEVSEVLEAAEKLIQEIPGYIKS